MTAATGTVVALSIVLFPGVDNVLAGIDGGVSAGTLLVLLLVATLSGVVKGVVGFGASLLATPIFAIIIDPTVAVIVLAVMPWMMNIFQIGETRTGLAYVREDWPLVVLAIVGTVLGLYLLASIELGAAVPFLIGVLLVAYVGYEILTGFVTIDGIDHPVVSSVVGFSHGFLIAVSNMGPVHPAYLHTIERDIERYVGGLSIVLAIILSLRLVVMYPLGLLTPYRLWLGSAIATASIGGLLLGTVLRRLGLDQSLFDRAVIALLCVLGLNLLRQTAPDVVL